MSVTRSLADMIFAAIPSVAAATDDKLDPATIKDKMKNCDLPDSLHRFANGAIGAGLSSLAVVAALGVLGVPLRTLWLVLPVALVCTALDPRRFSLVEGCAGDLCYDERPVDGEKPDAQDWGEALDA